MNVVLAVSFSSSEWNCLVKGFTTDLLQWLQIWFGAGSNSVSLLFIVIKSLSKSTFLSLNLLNLLNFQTGVDLSPHMVHMQFNAFLWNWTFLSSLVVATSSLFSWEIWEHTLHSPVCGGKEYILSLISSTTQFCMVERNMEIK